MKKIYNSQKSVKNKNSGRKVFGFFVVLIVVVGFIASIWFVMGLLNPKKIGEDATFMIEPGEGVNQISYNLTEAGLIRSPFVFETYVYLKGIEHRFIAGEYNLPSVVNIKRLTEILTTGQSAKEWEITVIEGWTVSDIADKLAEMGLFERDELFKATGVDQPGNKFSFDISDYAFLDDLPTNADLEGYLFPDTYRFFSYATIEDVIRKMFYNFDKKLTREMRADIEAQDKTIFDIVTMASIIEREVMSDEDRAIVSGIFWKRLDIGMALQADSTINYITGKKTPSISDSDLKIDSPYNTYMYPGLPPGPISNPGLSALEAAIYPEESEYWYFLTDKEGNVHYAKDFEEHKANKVKYLY